MEPFSVGDRVVIRQGERGGQNAEVVAAQPAEVYQVRMPDGSVGFYSGRQLTGMKEILAPAEPKR